MSRDETMLPAGKPAPSHARTDAPPRPRLLSSARLTTWGLYLLVGLLALALRVTDLGQFVIEDEARYWMNRSYAFLNALETGDFAATAISPHPGVTTMWAGTIGTVLRRSLLEWGLLAASPFPVNLLMMRLPVALVHTAGILVSYALLRRMLPLAVATLAVLLWATDPLILAMSRLLHVDGMTGTFATVSILAACFYWHHRRHMGVLVLSAVCGALAVLSKSPGLIVVPVVGMIALAGTCWPASDESGSAGWGAALRGLVLALLAWGAAYALTLIIVWPAVWADPGWVYHLLRVGVEVEGSSPHMNGNFFLGQPNDEPGWRFYPVALAMRATPWVWLGLLALPLVWHRAPISRASRRDMLVLIAFVILFIVALSLFPKKLNRYVMPAFPALNIVAAAGLIWSIDAVRHLLCKARATGLCAPHVAPIGLIGSLNAAHWHPYSIAYFNPLLGGAEAGPRVFLVGAGEGLEQAADWLNQQPDITGVVVASSITWPLQPYLKHGAQSLTREDSRLPDHTGYAVVYIRNVWNGAVPPFDRFYPHAPPLHTVTIHGVDYAWIYEVPPDLQHPLDVRFGPDIDLRGYAVATDPLTATGALSLTLQWHSDRSLETDYLMFAHVLNQDGQRVGQTDAPPGGDTPTSAWQPGRHQTWVHPVPLQASLPPGDYWLAIGLYDPQTSTRLPLDVPRPPDAPAAGGDALLLPLRMP